MRSGPSHEEVVNHTDGGVVFGVYLLIRRRHGRALEGFLPTELAAAQDTVSSSISEVKDCLHTAKCKLKTN